MSADRDDLARVMARADYTPSDGGDAWDALMEYEREGYLLLVDAALAWFAARAAAEGPDVEAVAGVLREHTFGYWTDDKGWEWAGCAGCKWGRDQRLTRSFGAHVHVTHVAEQIAALAPAAREVVETAECSYCFKRPAVGETPDGDSICEECAVPMADVAETLRMAAQIVERFAAETYPADVFLKPSSEDYAAINALLMRERGHALDGIAADCYRRALANAARLLREAADDPDLRS